MNGRFKVVLKCHTCGSTIGFDEREGLIIWDKFYGKDKEIPFSPIVVHKGSCDKNGWKYSYEIKDFFEDFAQVILQNYLNQK